MKRATSVKLSHSNKKAVTKFSKNITSKIYQKILTLCYSAELTEVAINKAAHILWQLDPCSTVAKGKFKGATSLMLYCVLSHLVQIKNLNINNLKELYSNIIKYPNLDINATFTSEGFYTGITVLWFAVNYKQWELADNLIEKGADFNSICTGESFAKGTSILWLATVYQQWKLVDKLIAYGANINATCIGTGTYEGISILWLAAYSEQWNLVVKLIKGGAAINAICMGEGPDKAKSILGMLQDINKDIFYLMIIAMHLRSKNFEYPADVILSDEDKMIIEKLKEKIKLYIKIFIPTTINFTDDNYYKKNYLNDLPEELRKIIALEYVKGELNNYSLSLECIEYFSTEINNYLFNISLEERSKAQVDLEKGPHIYELVLFSNILANLKDNAKMLDAATKENMHKNKKSVNELIFKAQFLPAFEKAKLQNKEIAVMNARQRLKLYENTKLYGNRVLSQQPAENILTEHVFSSIFGTMFR